MDNIKLYIRTYLLIILIEAAIIILTKVEVLSMNYGWEAKVNMLYLSSIATIQLIAIVLTVSIQDKLKQIHLLQAQSILYIIVFLWVGMEIGIDYQIMDKLK